MATLKSDDLLTVNLAELDFAKIRTSLITYLNAQDRFKDYNFAGSNLSEIIDVLSYNDHYMAFYFNMLASEIHLDTAIRRESVVSRAKPLGYIPKSTRSATAAVDLTLHTETIPAPSEILVPAQTTLTTDILGTKYTFYTSASQVALASNGYLIQDVELIEGRFFTYKKVATDTEVTDGVIIPNANVDSSKLRVTVYPTNNSVVGTEFVAVGDSIDITGSSAVYFLSESPSLRYQIKFGDGVLGRPIAAGNLVVIEYYISSGSAANGATDFTLSGSVINVSSVDITVTSPASGGAEIETVESIKANAPLTYQSQHRVVTANDAIATVVDNFPQCEVVTAWGGEENEPVALGYVFISVKPVGRLTLSDYEKNQIEQFLLASYSVLAIQPIMVDPEFLYVRVTSVVKYKPITALVTTADIQNDVKLAVQNVFATVFSKFKNYMRYSKLNAVIDASNTSITNSLTDIDIERRAEISNVAVGNYRIDFYNQVIPSTLGSENFTYGATSACYLKDNGSGSVGVYQTVSGSPTLVAAGVGTIDYVHGTLSLSAFMMAATQTTKPTETLRVYAQPLQNDVFVLRNVLLTVDSTTLFISASLDSV